MAQEKDSKASLLRPKLSLETLSEACLYPDFDFLDSDNSYNNPASTGLEELPPLPETSPPSPVAQSMVAGTKEKAVAVEKHVEELFAVANEKPRAGMKRPREDEGDTELMNPAKKARIMNRFKDLVFNNLYGATCEDRHIMTLQMVALESMRCEIDSLKTNLLRREEEERCHAASMVVECIRHRGLELKAHGEFLISLAGGSRA